MINLRLKGIRSALGTTDVGSAYGLQDGEGIVRALFHRDIAGNCGQAFHRYPWQAQGKQNSQRIIYARVCVNR